MISVAFESCRMQHFHFISPKNVKPVVLKSNGPNCLNGFNVKKFNSKKANFKNIKAVNKFKKKRMK